MSANSAQDLRDLASSTFQKVGPSRIAVLMIYALTQDDLADDSRHALAQTAVTRIRVANETLANDFGKTLAGIGEVESQDLRDARAAALDVLAPLISALDAGAAPTQHILGNVDAFRDICIDVIDPVITQFLRLMMQELNATASQVEKAKQTETLKTVTSAKAVGRSIHAVAINATIEAAREGVHGQGFRTIALEIRSLADRAQSILEDLSKRISNH